MILLLYYPFSLLQGFTSWGEYITQSPLAITPQWISSWCIVHMINLESPLPLSNCRPGSAYHASFIFTWTNGSFRQKVPTFYFYWLLGRRERERKKREQERESTTSCSKNRYSNKEKKEGWGQSGWWWWGVFLEGWGGRLIVLNKGTFIFVLRSVTASGNSSVSWSGANPINLQCSHSG